MSMFFIDNWIKKPTYIEGIYIGLLYGLMILIRPTMILTLVFPLFYKVNSVNTLMSRLGLIKDHYLKILAIAIAAFLVFIPQLIYWKIATGDFVYYSYSHEGFFFDDPQLINFLFSFRKGWLLYTPIISVALIGLVIMFYKKNNLATALFLPVSIYLYVSSCWWVWWFGGSFGCRTMIDTYPF